MNLVKCSDGDWKKVRRNFQRIDSVLFGPNATPTFANTYLTDLTANALMYPDSDGLLTSLAVATNGQIPIGSTGLNPVLAEITGTANQVTVTSGAGSITLSLPQDIHTGAIPQFLGLGLGEAGSEGEIQITASHDHIHRVDIENTSSHADARAGFIARSDEAQVVLDVFSSNDAGGLANAGVLTVLSDTKFVLWARQIGGAGDFPDIEFRTDSLYFTMDPVGTAKFLGLTNLIIPDGAYIGSANDTDAIQIEADGDVVMSQDLAVSGTLGVTGVATIGDGSLLASDAAPTTDPMIANKKYVDDVHAGAPSAHNHDTDTLQLDGINSDGGAFSFTTSGLVTFSESITMSAGKDLTIAGHVIFNTNNSYIGFTNPRITFDDNNNKLVVTGGLEVVNPITEFSTDGTMGGNSDSALPTEAAVVTYDAAQLAAFVGQANIVTVGTIATGTWEATDVGIAHGGTGQSTAQAAIDALTAVGAATNEHVLTKDTASGNAIWKAASGGADAFTVKVDGAATAGYLGVANNDGVLRGADPIIFSDGGDYVSLSLSYGSTLEKTGSALGCAVGIADDKIVQIDSATVASGEYAKFTAAGLESKSIAEVKTDLGITGIAGESTARCRVTLSSDQSIGSGSATKVTLDQEDYDLLSEFASNKYTATESGYYHISANVNFEISADPDHAFYVYIYKNGATCATAIGHSGNPSNSISVSISTDIYLDGSTDYIELYVFQTTGGNVNISGASASDYAWTQMSVHKLEMSSLAAIDATATAGYIGAASSDGILRTGAGLTYTDGGDYVTLAVSGTFVDRGDPSSADWTQATLTEDGTWNDLDLSSIVPAGAIAVAMYVKAYQASPGDAIRFRENGNSNAYNMSRMVTQVANRWIENDLVVACDSNRVIEYNADNTTWDGIEIVIKGWWI